MAKGLSETAHRMVLDYYFNATTPSAAPTQIWVSLHTADPGYAAATAAATEIATGSYAREEHNDWDNTTGTGTAPTTISNAAAITFTTATADWEDGSAASSITHAGIWKAVSGVAAADYIGRAVLTTPRTVSNGDTASFAIDALDIQIDET